MKEIALPASSISPPTDSVQFAQDEKLAEQITGVLRPMNKYIQSNAIILWVIWRNKMFEEGLLQDTIFLEKLKVAF